MSELNFLQQTQSMFNDYAKCWDDLSEIQKEWFCMQVGGILNINNVRELMANWRLTR